jgi:hypothetical protein
MKVQSDAAWSEKMSKTKVEKDENTLAKDNLPEGATVEIVKVGDKEGVIVRAPNGRFLPGTNTPSQITTENQRGMRARRYQLAADAARAGMLKHVQECGTLDIDLRQPVDAWGELVGHAAGLAMVSDSARGLAELGRFVGQAAQMLPDQRERSDEVEAGGVRLTLWGDALDRVLEVLTQPRGEVVHKTDDIDT